MFFTVIPVSQRKKFIKNGKKNGPCHKSEKKLLHNGEKHGPAISQRQSYYIMVKNMDLP
jgi:hypothetical protein